MKVQQDDEALERLADRLRIAREASGKRPELIAGEVDISLRTLMGYEGRYGRPPEIGALTLQRFAEATGKPLLWFYGLEEIGEVNARDRALIAGVARKLDERAADAEAAIQAVRELLGDAEPGAKRRRKA